ncbi:MAG: penicillin-binding protein 2 [Solirubrobacteraceae bacterium]
MIQLPEDRRPPLTPQLALRVAVIGSCALAMFAIIFFRLWFLQVLSGDAYAHQAQVNRVRDISVPAPRGAILDRSGNILVDSRAAIAVQLSVPDLPRNPGARAREFKRLAFVLGVSNRPASCAVSGAGVLRLARIPCEVAQQQAALPYANVTLKTDVAPQVHFYLAERSDQFPGVSVEQVYLRAYPLSDTAAQLFGTVGPITKAEVTAARYRGVSQNAIVGQAGLEYEYDHFLRGIDGAEKVQVDALGSFKGYLPGRLPVAGHNLKLSVDLKLQQVGQQALQQSIDANPPANGGAFVAMNPQDGEIYAMGSLPAFDPSVFTRPISNAKYDQLFGAGSGDPQFNRAIQSAGPDGSTFKPITATAALQSGAWSVDEAFDDTGQFCEGTLCRHNAGHAAYGVITLVDAIKFSSDVFFYNLGALINSAATNGGALQKWASLYGIGRPTGVDLPGESSGNLPSPKWRDHVNQLEAQCDNATGPFMGHPKHAPGGCGIADGTNRPWSVGDNVNLAVGQGDVQVTPLQLATAYATIANGGTVVRPHVGLEVDAADGTVLQKIEPPPARHIPINPAYLETIRAGLRAAASQPGGTSADVFSSFPEAVYGKTGTAQYNGQQDYAWYACFVPSSATSTPIVIVVTVAQGGFGAAAAAPVARQMLSQWFFGKKGQYVAGTSTTL